MKVGSANIEAILLSVTKKFRFSQFESEINSHNCNIMKERKKEVEKERENEHLRQFQ